MISRSSWSSGTGDEGVRVLEIAGIDHPYLGFVSRSKLLGVPTVEPGRRKDPGVDTQTTFENAFPACSTCPGTSTRSCT
jgi:hypothetical protein